MTMNRRRFLAGSSALAAGSLVGATVLELLPRAARADGCVGPKAAVQGTALGRDGRVYVERRGGDIWIGGDCAPLVKGKVDL